MKVTFDEQRDAATITVQDVPDAETVAVGRNGRASFDAAGRAIVVEVGSGAAALGLPDVESAERIVANMEAWHRGRTEVAGDAG